MKKKRIVGLFSILLLMLFSVGATDLQTVIQQAKQNSSRIQLIELNKANSNITVAMSEVEPTLGIRVSGNVNFREVDFGTPVASDKHLTMQASPTVVISLPNDNNTKITIGTTAITKALDTSGYWGADPSVGITHTFQFGDNGDTLTDLKLAQQRLSIDYQYNESLYNFESSIYSKIIEILGYEMDLLEAEKNLLVQQTQIDNALALRTISEGSTTYRNMLLNLARLENSKTAILQKLDMAHTQYEYLTGMSYEPIETIMDAELSFTYLPTGDTSVILAAMALEIANEELALTQRRTVQSTGGKSVPSLVVGGETGIDYSDFAATPSISYSVGAQATYNANNLSTNAAVTIGISDTGKVTPSFTIGGSWSNNQTIASDVMQVQTLQNNITIAGINYQEAMLTYQSDASQLETDILTYRLNVDAFQQEAAYREQMLEEAQDAFERGLITETEVNQAQLNVELTSYQNKIYALQALILENRAKALQL